MKAPFKDLLIAINTKGQRLLSWTFQGLAEVPQNTSITVQWARSGGPWQTLYISPNLICCYTDSRKTNKNKFNNDFYRLKLQTVSGQQYISDAVQAGINVSYPYSAEAKNLLRLADLQMQKTGRSGKLLKKITYGEDCPYCKSFKDDNPINQHCPECLGTGKKGGYYTAFKLNILEQSQQQTQSMSQFGLLNNAIMNAKTIAWPMLEIGDVWVDDNTNQRYIIESAAVVSKYKHVPLLCVIRMHKLQKTDILHHPTVQDLLQDTLVTVEPRTEENSWQKVFQ